MSALAFTALTLAVLFLFAFFVTECGEDYHSSRAGAVLIALVIVLVAYVPEFYARVWG